MVEVDVLDVLLEVELVELEVLDVDEDVLEVEVVSDEVDVDELVELVDVLVKYRLPPREVPSLIAPINQLSYW